MTPIAITAWFSLLGMACGPYPGVAVVGANDEQALIVDSALRSWADAAGRKPKLSAVRFLDATDDDDGELFAEYSQPDIRLWNGLSGWNLVRLIHHEMGHAFDYSRPTQFSAGAYWDVYDDEAAFYDRGEERYAQTASLGPDGLRLIPEPGSTSCALNETADDAAVVRADLLRPGGLDLQPAAPVTRSIQLPDGAWAPSLFKVGEDGVGFVVDFEHSDFSTTVLIPDLDLSEAYTSLYGTKWADVVFDKYALFPRGDVAPTWAPGLGVALENPTPIGDGSTQVSLVRMDHTQAFYEKDDLYLTLETTVETGEVVAVHDAACPSYGSFAEGYPGRVVKTSEGVWLVNAMQRGEPVTMRFFPDDGRPRPAERWVVENNPLTLVREQ